MRLTTQHTKPIKSLKEEYMDMSYVIDYTDGRRVFDGRSGIIVDFSGLLVNGDGKGIERIKSERQKIDETIEYIPIFSHGMCRIWETNMTEEYECESDG